MQVQSLYACMHNYPEVLSHCGHGHDLTSVAQLSIVNTTDIRSAFVETLASECFRQNVRHSREARQRQASLLVYIYTYVAGLAGECVARYGFAIHVGLQYMCIPDSHFV